MSEEQRSGRSSRGKATRAAVAVPATILMPFVLFWRSLRSIWKDPNSRGVLITAGLLLVAGTIIFRITEGFSLLDSFYFSFVTLATIGYGDLAPVTDLGKLVTVIYGITGLGVMAAFISAMASQNRRRRTSKDRGQTPG